MLQEKVLDLCTFYRWTWSCSFISSYCIISGFYSKGKDNAEINRR